VSYWLFITAIGDVEVDFAPIYFIGCFATDWFRWELFFGTDGVWL